jgi:hypothetical protein
MFVNRMWRNEQSQQRTFHRCSLPSFGSFGETVLEEKNLKNQPIRNKNPLWWPCLLTDRDGMSTLYRGPSIDASYQVSDHLDKWFQRRRFLEIEQSEIRIANRNYSAILATLQITLYALGVLIALLFTCQLHESLIKLYFKQFSIFQLKF